MGLKKFATVLRMMCLISGAKLKFKKKFRIYGQSAGVEKFLRLLERFKQECVGGEARLREMISGPAIEIIFGNNWPVFLRFGSVFVAIAIVD